MIVYSCLWFICVLCCSRLSYSMWESRKRESHADLHETLVKNIYAMRSPPFSSAGSNDTKHVFVVRYAAQMTNTSLTFTCFNTSSPVRPLGKAKDEPPRPPQRQPDYQPHSNWQWVWEMRLPLLQTRPGHDKREQNAQRRERYPCSPLIPLLPVPVLAASGYGQLRPISLLRLSLLRFVDSRFPGNSLWTWEFHPSTLRFCLSQTLRNPES